MTDLQANQDGVSIMLLCPSMGTAHDGAPAHCTLVYAGEVEHVSLQTAIIMDSTVQTMALITPRFSVDVMGTDMFGKKRDERVLLLDQPVLLMALRLRVAHWHRSEYKVYKPHVATAHVQPETIRFEGLALWYGTKRIVYPLRGGDHGPDDAGDLGGRGEGAPG